MTLNAATLLAAPRQKLEVEDLKLIKLIFHASLPVLIVVFYKVFIEKYRLFTEVKKEYSFLNLSLI